MCVYIHNLFTIFVVLLLLAFCYQSARNIIVTLITLCFSLSICRFVLLNVCILQSEAIERSITRISLFFYQIKSVTEWMGRGAMEGHASGLLYACS